MKVWHMSDPHLSFDKEYKPIKRMDERRWSRGCPAYSGYLDKMADFGKNQIAKSDFTFITGDILHDMKQDQSWWSFRWLRENINGTIIICRGNHDKFWDVSRVRQNLKLDDFYILDEGELMSIGPFTIGCFSDHVNKNNNWNENGLDARYLEMAQRIATQAKAKNKKPVMISHYPVNVEHAEKIGALGVKAYMSGHVHITNNSVGDGCIATEWYDQSAALTDDLTFNGCFFSTGTTDVLLHKHGQIFKEIKALQDHTLDHQELNKHKNKAARYFHCEPKYVNKFEREDPFNQGMELAGFICRKKGPMQGSLYITHVNGMETEGQFIHGTPKLEYPYKNDNSRDYKQFPKFHTYMVAEKWNGMNVLFYKYKDTAGKEYVTAKSKGTPFLNDSELGSFLSLTKEVVARGGLITTLMEGFVSGPFKAFSFELCGQKEPHLVNYSFDIDLKPLFLVDHDGKIKPAAYLYGQEGVSSDDLVEILKDQQKTDHEANLKYREEKGLPHKYEYNHFKVEGKVLYLLDEQGYLINRTMYKIKPEDVEEVHWQTFNATMQGRVREAVEKIKENNAPINEETVMQELDMGPKEWDKFGRVVMQYLRAGAENPAEVVVLCGIPGSGKSTVAKILANKGYVRVNQDELGSRNACKKVAAEAIKKGQHVVIDRCNFDERQRKAWIDLAHELGISRVKAVYIDVPEDVCLKRAIGRKGHETIKDEETAKKAVAAMASVFTEPKLEEGFISVIKVEQDKPAHETAHMILENK